MTAREYLDKYPEVDALVEDTVRRGKTQGWGSTKAVSELAKELRKLPLRFGSAKHAKAVALELLIA